MLKNIVNRQKELEDSVAKKDFDTKCIRNKDT